MSSLPLNEYIFKVNKPCVFKNMLTRVGEQNSACEWNFEKLASLLKNQTLTFRIGNKHASHIQFENECEYVEATVEEFMDWKQGSDSEKSEKKPKMNDSEHQCHFTDYNLNEKWAYADYKYMIELVDSKIKLQPDCIDWSAFGFADRNAKESTLWLGTAGAYTPCHYDSYGYNLVAQIYGRKRWILFEPTETKYLKPRRVPFEDSTVYSSINIKRPDLKTSASFNKVAPYVVELEPGDILYVPHKWWHHVESLTDSISINTWVQLDIDDRCRLTEILSKTLIQGLMDSNVISYENWLNSSEVYNSQEENVLKVKECLEEVKRKTRIEPSKNDVTDKEVDYERLIQSHENFEKFLKRITYPEFERIIGLDSFQEDESCDSSRNDDDSTYQLSAILTSLANSVADPRIVEIIAENLLNNDF